MNEPSGREATEVKESAGSAEIDRRSFLKYVGAGATALAGAQLGSLIPLGCAAGGGRTVFVHADGTPDWVAPRYPVPLPGDPGDATTDAVRFASYEVQDRLVLPEGFRFDIIAEWGDRFGNGEHEVSFGYNNDYTGLLPIPGTENELWLFVNHEYLSFRPWSESYEAIKGETLPSYRLTEDPDTPWLYRRGRFSIDDWKVEQGLGNGIDLRPGIGPQEIPAEVREKIRDTCEKGLAELGVSVLRVRRLSGGRFEVIADATDHRRISGHRSENVEPGSFRFSGPASFLFTRDPSGTLANCSGGTTPWGTFLTCEENFHYEMPEAVSPAGLPLEASARPFGGRGDEVNGEIDYGHDRPTNLNGLGNGISEPLDGREYGWVCEVDPTTGRMVKHTALGRFHHENVTLRCEKGERLAAYMGDDRRGGHVWKFVSDGVVRDPTDPANSRLLEKGTLYVARFEEGFTGRWIPLVPETPLRRPEPEYCFSSHVRVPARFVGGAVAVGDTDRDRPALEVEDWVSIIESFAGKPFAECTLGDLVTPEAGASGEETRERKTGVLVTDAFLMANAVGGTPSARPEDLEVHPIDRSVYVAFTDSTDGSAGAPDQRIFPDSGRRNSRQYGAIYRIVEDGDDPASTTFGWGKFVSSGEVAEDGGGFACADNLVFDPLGNLWMVTDISTTAQNFPNERSAATGTDAGSKLFPGVFGNNAMFMIPTSGETKGIPQLFAIGPMESELTGPTFTADGKTLILAVQHPGERRGIRKTSNPQDVRAQIVHDRSNQPFEQKRIVPQGSNFPSTELDQPPRPCVVCITREG